MGNVDADGTSLNDPLPPPPTSGSETSLLDSGRNQDAIPTAPAQTPAQKKQLPINLPPYQAALEPERPEFDIDQYLQRAKGIFQSFAEGFGAAPTAAVAHDLNRSALTQSSVKEVAGDMAQKPLQGTPTTPDSIAELNTGFLSSSDLDKLRATKFVAVPGAPFRGLYYNQADNTYYYNPDEKASTAETKYQALRGTTDPQQVVTWIGRFRAQNPAAVAKVMPQINAGDIVGAALKLGFNAKDAVGTAAKLSAASAAQTAAHAVDVAHTAAMNVGLGTVAAQAKLGLISQDASNPLGVKIGGGSSSTLLGKISQLVGEATSGQHIGANVTLTDSAYKQLQALTEKEKAGLSPDDAKALDGYVQSLNPKNVDVAKNLSGLDRLKEGGEAAVLFGSVANPQGLVSAELNSSTENALLENGVDPKIAHIAGDVAGVAALGKSLNPGSLKSIGTFGRIGIGAAALGGAGVSLLQTQGEDPIERVADAVTGALMATTFGRPLGGAIDRVRGDMAQVKTVKLALQAQGGDDVARATLQRQADQLEAIKPLKETADAALQKVNDLALKREQGTTPGDTAPAKTSADLIKTNPNIGRGASAADLFGDLPERGTAEHAAIAKADEAANPSVDRTSVVSKLGGTAEGRAAEEAAANAEQEKTLNILTGATKPPVTKIAAPDAEWASSMKKWTDAQTAVDKAQSQYSRQVLGSDDPRTDVRKAFDSVNTITNVTPSGESSDAMFDHASRLQNGNNVLAESVVNALNKVIKTGPLGAIDADKAAAVYEGLWHPETISNILWPEVRQAVMDLRAGLADRGNQLPDYAKVAILDNYAPPVGKWKAIMESILTPDDPLSAKTNRLKVRTGDEATLRAEEPGTNPADAIKSYLEETGRAIINDRLSRTLQNTQFSDGTWGFIPSKLIGVDSRYGDLEGIFEGKKYVESFAPGLRGYIPKDMVPRLQALNKPGIDASGAHAALIGITQAYKYLAMKSPVHPWNVTAGAYGLTTDVIRAVRSGHELTSDPAQLAEAEQYVHLGAAEKSIYDMADRLVVKSPFLKNMIDQMQSVGHQTLGRYDHVVWTSYIRNLQAGLWRELSAKMIAAGKDPEDSKIAAGHFIDEITGMNDPKMMSGVERFLQRYLFFAYAWNRKHVTIPAEALGMTRKMSPWLSDEQAGLVTEMARGYLGRQMANAFILHTMTNIALSGHPPWENEKGRELDIETTRMNAILSAVTNTPFDTLTGGSGRTYSQNGLLNYINWYWKKGEIFSDFGGTAPIQAFMQNFTDLSAPLPGFLLSTMSSLNTETTGEAIGTGIQSLNPFQRNIQGPLVQGDLAIQEGKVEKPQSLLQQALGAVEKVPVFLTGLQQYKGAKPDFVPTINQLRDDRGLGLELARMGVDPHQATADQVAAAKKLYQQGLGPLGINPNEVMKMAGGAPQGTGSHYKELEDWLNTQIHDAVIQQLAGSGSADLIDSKTQAAEEKYSLAIRNKISPFKLLDSMEKVQLFKDHPEIGYALNAPSSSPDPLVRRTHDELVQYEAGLNKTLSDNFAKQQKFDADYQKGTMKLSDWIKQTQALRTADGQAFQDGLNSLSPDAKASLNKKPDDFTPMLPDEIAYWNYRQISYSDPKFQDENGVVDVSAYKQAQQDFLSKLPTDQRSYIENRQIQSSTPLVQKYLHASDEYSQFRAANKQYENLRTVYNTLTSFEKKLYRASNPQLDGYLSFRDNWFRTDPDGQAAGEFFHLTDDKAFAQEPTSKQAADLAEWYLDYSGSAKQKAYLTPWQLSLMQSWQSGSPLFAQTAGGLSDTDWAEFSGLVQAYHTEEAQYKANESAFIRNLLNKIFHKSTAPLSP